MVGGRTNSLQGKSDSNSVECYDPYTQEWTSIASLNSSRHRLGVAAVDDVIYAFGGSDGMIHLNTVEKYSIEKNLWEPAVSMNTPRIGKKIIITNYCGFMDNKQSYIFMTKFFFLNLQALRTLSFSFL